MTTMVMTPVRKTIQVAASRARAFEAFTAGMTAWWPRSSHTVLKAALKEVVIEPFVGGRWFHRGIDGSECDTGRVLVWSPPDRLVLGWQLNGRWRFEPETESEVEIRFIEIAAEITEIRLEHRLLERFAETAEALRQSVDGANGWPILLQFYAAHIVAKRMSPAAIAVRPSD
jgi:uncharacterized protein YndB with AHSA1/START domain